MNLNQTDMTDHCICDHPRARPLGVPPGYKGPLVPVCLLLGEGQPSLEVAVVDSDRAPTKATAREFWHARWQRRAVTLLLVICYPDKLGNKLVAVCGIDEPPNFYAGVSCEVVKTIVDKALELPDHHQAREFLQDNLPSLSKGKDQFNNQGLLPNHLWNCLKEDQEAKQVWSTQPRLETGKDREIISSLGYRQVDNPNGTSLLYITGREQSIAVAVCLLPDEHWDRPTERHLQNTPVAQALSVADNNQIQYVIVVKGRRLRLYLQDPKTGLGRGGRNNTYFEADLDLIPIEDRWLVSLMFSSVSLDPNSEVKPNICTLLEDALRFSAELGKRLRERVFAKVLPALAEVVTQASESESEVDTRGSNQSNENKSEDAPDLQTENGDDHHNEGNKEQVNLEHLFGMAMTILFRLLFVAYAEDQDLLSYRWNRLYRANSLKSIASELVSIREDSGDSEEEFLSGFGEQQVYWEKIKQIWSAIENGRPSWDIPKYNGIMFSSISDESDYGAEIDKLQVTDSVFGPLLTHLLVDQQDDGSIGQVDFRQLDSEEFGTIYEGLLEYEFEWDNSSDDQAQIRVVKGAEESGSSEKRRSSGTYFTPKYAVRHLLATALRPAIDNHLTEVRVLVDAGNTKQAADRLFEFRVADISMGSGHFLVEAIDVIESKYLDFLQENDIPELVDKLEAINRIALEGLGDLAEHYDIDKSSLLRRMIARHCIYGVDLTPLAVDLARFAIWIKTFVPGLPLSYLDHNLRCGNSLIGIGTQDEAREELARSIVRKKKGGDAGSQSDPLQNDFINDWLDRSSGTLERFEQLDDATPEEVEESKQLDNKIHEEVAELESLYDLMTARRIVDIPLIEDFETPKEISNFVQTYEHTFVDLKNTYQPVHFPIAFPEVFGNSDSTQNGFDSIIGNPPWEKLEREDPSYLLYKYASYIRSGKGRNDLSRAFGWRFNQLIKPESWIGVCLPNSLMVGEYSSEWRKRIFREGTIAEFTLLLNQTGFFHKQVHNSFKIALLSYCFNEGIPKEFTVHGIYSKLDHYNQSCIAQAAGGGGGQESACDHAEITIDWLRKNNPELAITIPGTAFGATVYLKLMSSDILQDNPWSMSPKSHDLSIEDTDYLLGIDKCLGTSDGEKVIPILRGSSIGIIQARLDSVRATISPSALMTLERAKGKVEAIKKELSKQGISKNQLDNLAMNQAIDECIREQEPQSILRLTNPAILEQLNIKKPRIVVRQIARTDDTRTVYACLIPSKALITPGTRSVEIVLPRKDYNSGDLARDEAYILGIFGSKILDWFVRSIVELNVVSGIIRRFPIPYLTTDDPIRIRIETCSANIATSDLIDLPGLSDWLDSVSVSYRKLNETEITDQLALLDSLVAMAFKLNRIELEHIFDTFFPDISNLQQKNREEFLAHKQRVLVHFDRLKSEI